MIARQGTWGELQVGMYLKDQNDVTWKITKERDFNFLVENRDGVKHRLMPRDPKTPVTILEPTDDEALATIKKALKAVEMGHKVPSEAGWRVEALPTRSGAGVLDDYRGHLFMFHGVFAGDVKTLAGMIECHEETHRTPMKGHQAHTHQGGNPA